MNSLPPDNPSSHETNPREIFPSLGEPLFETISLPLCLIGEGGEILLSNPAFEALLAKPGDKISGQPLSNFDTRTKQSGENGSALFRRFDGSLISQEVRTSRLSFDGRSLTLLSLFPAPQPPPSGGMIPQLLESSPAGVLILGPDHSIRKSNGAFSQMVGYAADEIAGLSANVLVDTGGSLHRFDRFIHEIAKNTNTSGTFRIRKKDGETLFVQAVGALLPPERGEAPGILLIVFDITPLYHSHKKIERQLSHDPLTHLPNRAGFDQAISGAIARARRKGAIFAVCTLDIDDFRPVNEALGTESGNKILEEFARRLSANLRQSDFLARLSGDEFGLLIEDLSLDKTVSQLSLVLERLHRTVESPFSVPMGNVVRLGMSMGIALYPSSGEEGESLFREAEAALYQSKSNKTSRAQWWALGSFIPTTPALETSFDAYGPESREILTRHQEHIRKVILEFIEAFMIQEDKDPETLRILSAQDEEGLQKIAQAQSAHLAFLFAPERTREDVVKMAHRVGQIHALNGVDGAMLAQTMAIYRRILSEHLSQTFLTARDRYRLLLSNEVRLQDDLQEELRASTETMSDYFSVLSAPLPEQGSLWTDVREKEVALIGSLPGILCVFLMRLDSQGQFIVENSAGSRGREGAAIMQDKAYVAVADPNDPRGQGLIGHAWRSREIQRTSNYRSDDRLHMWQEVVRPIGIRSGISIPILDPEGGAQAILSLYGAYPNQFDSHWMIQFSRGLAQRWERLWALSRAPVAAIPETRAREYRQELFSGGLSMYIQPVVNLTTGKVVKVEALARLIRPGGEVVPPGLFLPSLGDAELDRLFREGLDQALGWVSRWRADGLSLDISLNLPPGTLRDSNCPVWIEEALSRHKVEAAHLTLELLENSEIDPKTMDQAIERLVSLGVKLAMDDLGSGFSSLQRLVTLPFDNIKVDQGLLRRIRTAPLHTLSMIGTIVRMGLDFERDVVVEGLEDKAMVEAAAILGAPFGQGYALARPMPATAVPEWFRGFTLPFTPGEITTALGGLSFHRWTHMTGGAPHLSDIGSCPLSRLFSVMGNEGEEGARIHAKVHESEPGDPSKKLLTLWLVEQIRKEQEEIVKRAGKDRG